MPTLTREGWWALVGACAALILGVALEIDALHGWVLGVWFALGAAYTAMLARLDDIGAGRIGARVVGLVDGEAAGHPGATVDIDVVVQNTTATPLHGLGLVLEPSAGMAVARAPELRGGLAGGAECSVAIGLRLARSGRWSLGTLELRLADALGVCELRTESAPAQVVTVVPDGSVAGARASVSASTHLLTPLGGEDFAHRAGDGNELRELRPYVAGDPLSRVAWKATARTGQLMVREHHDDVPATTVVVVDIASTVQGGEGAPRLEYALATAQVALEVARRARDRTGLVSVADELVGALEPSSGAQHELRLAQHLVEIARLPASGVVEPDALAVDVGDWVRRHLGLDFREKVGGALGRRDESSVDDELLGRWIVTRHPGALARAAGRLAEAGIDPSRLDAIALFACERGIGFRPRPEPRFGVREVALAHAIEVASAGARQALTVVVCTDLCGIVDVGPLQRAVAGIAARRGRVLVVAPFTPDFAQGSDGAAITAAFRHAEHTERSRIVRELRDAGARVALVGPDVPPAAVLQQLARGR